jgi:hypothetical protein
VRFADFVAALERVAAGLEREPAVRDEERGPSRNVARCVRRASPARHGGRRAAGGGRGPGGARPRLSISVLEKIVSRSEKRCSRLPPNVGVARPFRAAAGGGSRARGLGRAPFARSSSSSHGE